MSGAGLVGQAEVFQQLVDPGIVVADAKVARLDAQGLAHIEKGVEHQLLRHDAQALARGGKVALHVVPQHGHAPAAGTRQPGKNADEGGFAGPVGAQQAKEFTFLDVQADILQRMETAPGGGEVLEMD